MIALTNTILALGLATNGSWSHQDPTVTGGGGGGYNSRGDGLDGPVQGRSEKAVAI
jgi:hypothetical protein